MSTELFKYLAKITKGFFTDEKIDRLIELFINGSEKYYFDSETEANLIRIISSLFDRIFFLEESLRYPKFSETLLSIAASSNYLTDIIVRNPELIYLALDSNYVRAKLRKKEILSDYLAFSKNAKSFAAKINHLKLIQRKSILRIGLNDIMYNSYISLITSELSVLASTICDLAFSECVKISAQKHGIEKLPVKYSLCALGKLGGRELNYSSDIDLILFYDNDSFSDEYEKKYLSILTDATHLFIKALSEINEKGFLYRVDFRLRPDGTYSPLCFSLHQMINYYDTRGEDWEKQMLIKLDFVSGSRRTFKSFFNFAQKYIYSENFSRSPLRTIRLMKENIERYTDILDNVKTASGGIRDIEFIVQALQLINGKKFPQLHSGNTLIALNRLYRYKLLSKQEFNELKSSYILLRKIEHFLQLMNNRQTHSIPDDINLKTKLAKYLKYQNVTDFEKTLKDKMQSVKNIFNLITGEETEELGFSFNNFLNPQRAKSNFEYLSRGSGTSHIKTFDKFTIQKFDYIRSFVLDYLKTCKMPDRTLDNFVKLTRTNLFVSNWYSFLNNKKLCRDLLKVCEFSLLSIDNIVYANEISTTTLATNFFIKLTDDIKSFDNQIVKAILAAQYVLGFINENEISVIYSNYIRQKLFDIANSVFTPKEICIVALGSLAVNEMNFFSDVDLILFVENFSATSNISKKISDFVQQINNKIRGTKIDFRLRPEGKNSELTADLDYLKKYYKSRARVWEFQTLLKSDLVFGNQELYAVFKDNISEIEKALPRERLLLESIEMYNKLVSSSDMDNNLGFDLKKSNGGFLTIDFLLSFLFLLNNLNNSRQNLKFVDRINDLILLNSNYKELDSLKSSYSFFKKLLISLQIFFNKQVSRIPTNDEMNLFCSWLGYSKREDFESELNFYIKNNKELFIKYLTKQD